MASTPELATIPIGTQAIRKVQIRILPYLFVLYVICYLDRVNIGIAALTMNQDLAITSEQFGLLTGIFFIGYFLFEVPSNQSYVSNIGTEIQDTVTSTDAGLAKESLGVSCEPPCLPNKPPVLHVGAAESVTRAGITCCHTAVDISTP